MRPSKLELEAFTIVAPRSPLSRRLLLKGVSSALTAAPLVPLLSRSSAGAAANDNAAAAAGGPGVPSSG